MKKSNCSECGSSAAGAKSETSSSNNKASLSYWTPQTHRRSYHNRSKRHGHHHRKSEMVQSMVYSHKQHQFYSPQLQRRKSEDFINYHKQYHQKCETSDSSDEETEHHPQQNLFTSQSQQQQLTGVGGPATQHLPAHALTQPPPPVLSASGQPAARRLQYYGGVHPVYLPNSRSKAEKLQKMPLYHQHCQGCCQHQLHHRMKTGDDKRCIIS